MYQTACTSLLDNLHLRELSRAHIVLVTFQSEGQTHCYWKKERKSWPGCFHPCERERERQVPISSSSTNINVNSTLLLSSSSRSPARSPSPVRIVYVWYIIPTTTTTTTFGLLRRGPLSLSLWSLSRGVCICAAHVTDTPSLRRLTLWSEGLPTCPLCPARASQFPIATRTFAAGARDASFKWCATLRSRVLYLCGAVLCVFRAKERNFFFFLLHRWTYTEGS